MALCLMHPLDPAKGCSPSSLLSIACVKELLRLADKYNMQVCAERWHGEGCVCQCVCVNVCAGGGGRGAKNRGRRVGGALDLDCGRNDSGP